MKRIILSATLLLSIFSSCARESETEKLAKFNEEVNALTKDYQNKYQYFSSNPNMTPEQIASSIDSLYNVTMPVYKDLCLSTLRKNRDNSVGVEALKVIATDLEPNELKEALSLLKGKAKEDKSIKAMQAYLDAVLSTAEGTMFKDFEVDGVKFSDFVGRGKYILVDFWASWCGPCKQEIPYIAEVYKKYSGENFDVLSVAVWDKPEDTKKAAAEHGVVWNQMINTQKVAADLYGVVSIPQIMLFGPDGTLLKRNLRGEGIEKAVKEVLGR